VTDVDYPVKKTITFTRDPSLIEPNSRGELEFAVVSSSAGPCRFIVSAITTTVDEYTIHIWRMDIDEGLGVFYGGWAENLELQYRPKRPWLGSIRVGSHTPTESRPDGQSHEEPLRLHQQLGGHIRRSASRAAELCPWVKTKHRTSGDNSSTNPTPDPPPSDPNGASASVNISAIDSAAAAEPQAVPESELVDGAAASGDALPAEPEAASASSPETAAPTSPARSTPTKTKRRSLPPIPGRKSPIKSPSSTVDARPRSQEASSPNPNLQDGDIAHTQIGQIVKPSNESSVPESESPPPRPAQGVSTAGSDAHGDGVVDAEMVQADVILEPRATGGTRWVKRAPLPFCDRSIEVSPFPVNHQHPEWTDAFSVDTDETDVGAGQHGTLTVTRVDANPATGEVEPGWEQDLELQYRSTEEAWQRGPSAPVDLIEGKARDLQKNDDGALFQMISVPGKQNYVMLLNQRSQLYLGVDAHGGVTATPRGCPGQDQKMIVFPEDSHEFHSNRRWDSTKNLIWVSFPEACTRTWVQFGEEGKTLVVILALYKGMTLYDITPTVQKHVEEHVKHGVFIAEGDFLRSLLASAAIDVGSTEIYGELSVAYRLDD
jgi:hypothetical protein